jgi:hypothetical protein
MLPTRPPGSADEAFSPVMRPRNKQPRQAGWRTPWHESDGAGWQLRAAIHVWLETRGRGTTLAGLPRGASDTARSAPRASRNQHIGTGSSCYVLPDTTSRRHGATCLTRASHTGAAQSHVTEASHTVALTEAPHTNVSFAGAALHRDIAYHERLPQRTEVKWSWLIARRTWMSDFSPVAL